MVLSFCAYSKYLGLVDKQLPLAQCHSSPGTPELVLELYHHYMKSRYAIFPV